MPFIDWPAGSTVWVGTPGRWLPICGTGVDGSLSVKGGVEFSLSRTVDGGQRAQMVRAPRQWSGSVAILDPGSLGSLLELQDGAYGPGPFRLVTPDMQVGNVLTPAQSVWAVLPAGAAYGGPRTSPNGDQVAQSLTATTPVTLGAAPVLAGSPVTVSAWVQGAGARMRVDKLSSSGAVIESVTTTALEGAASQRVSVSWDAQPSEWSVRVVLLPGSTAAVVYGLQVTWTHGTRQWAPGLGVERVVLSGGGHDLQFVSAGHAFVSASFTADEVA